MSPRPSLPLEACPRPDRGAGVHEWLSSLDSRSPIGVEDKLRGNDENGCVLAFYEFVNIDTPVKSLQTCHSRERGSPEVIDFTGFPFSRE